MCAKGILFPATLSHFNAMSTPLGSYQDLCPPPSLNLFSSKSCFFPSLPGSPQARAHERVPSTANSSPVCPRLKSLSLLGRLQCWCMCVMFFFLTENVMLSILIIIKIEVVGIWASCLQLVFHIWYEMQLSAQAPMFLKFPNLLLGKYLLGHT